MYVQKVVGICFPLPQKWILDPSMLWPGQGVSKAVILAPLLRTQVPIAGGGGRVTVGSLFAGRGTLRGSRRIGQHLPGGKQPPQLTPRGPGDCWLMSLGASRINPITDPQGNHLDEWLVPRRWSWIKGCPSYLSFHSETSREILRRAKVCRLPAASSTLPGVRWDWK